MFSLSFNHLIPLNQLPAMSRLTTTLGRCRNLTGAALACGSVGKLHKGAAGYLHQR